MKYVAEIILGETTSRERLDAPQLTVGSSAEASITIADPTLAGEVVVLTPHAEACTVTRIRNARGDVRLDGQSFDRGDVPWGSELMVGSAHLKLLAEDKSEGVSPVLLLGAACALGMLVWSFGEGPARASILKEMPPPPELFAAEAACPKGNAAHRGGQLEDAALARADRAPFDLRDGMAAARAFAQAAACYDAAGHAEDSGRVTRRGDAWRSRMESRYKALRLRLRLSLDNRQTKDALAEIEQLKALLDGSDHDYVTWLSRVERRLRIVAEQEEK